MIPFFSYLSGRAEAIEHAARILELGKREEVDLLGDGTRVNLSMLRVADVDWSLKQIVQACVALALTPDRRIYLYGQALYSIIGAPVDDVWRGDFTERQRVWIDTAAQVTGH